MSYRIIVGRLQQAYIFRTINDYAHGGKFDWQDIIASMIGAIMFLTIRLILAICYRLKDEKYNDIKLSFSERGPC